MIHEHQVAFFLRELTSPDPARRAAAVKGLGHVPGHVPELAAATDDGSPEVRAAAALGLGRQGAADESTRLVALCSDPDAEVRRRAVNALVRIGATGPAVTEAFVRRVGDAELRNRAAVLGWLLHFEVPVPGEALMPLLVHRDSLIWGPARFLLRLLPEADAVFADLVRTGSPEVRRRALDMLRANRAGIPGLRHRAGLGAREEAWRRLWDPDPRVVPALLAALADETEWRARGVLFDALAVHRAVEAVAPAAAWLDDPECGPSAAGALGAAGTAEAVDLLRRFATGPRSAVRRRDARLRGAAVRALGAAGGVSDAELLFGLLGDREEAVRLGAVAGLGAFFERSGDTMLGRLERWRAERVPGQAVLPPKGDPVLDEMAHRAAHRLVRMLTGDAGNATTYHGALWNIPEVRPLLPALLDDPQGEVRSIALYLAEHFGDVDFAVRLRLLDDPHPSVRHNAAMTFERLAKQRSLTQAEQDELRPRLERAREDPDDWIRLYAARTLAHFAPPEQRGLSAE